ncbi:hypothetical protein HY946_01345 [Candidatus Gottesmanbacteria bacterium]|nr:hypothetical protein [Candidatus Gottesmanbacteria bacterium]
MKQAKVIVLILIVVILLVGVVVGKNLLAPKPGEPKAGWQTYPDNEQKYKFNYPKGWFLYTGNPNQLTNYDIEKAPSREFDPELDKDKIKIEIYTTDQAYETIEKYLEEQEKGEKMGQEGPAPSYETISLDNQRALKTVETRLGSISIYVKNPVTAHIHSITAMPNYNLHQAVVDEIIATFKFTQESGGLPAKEKETDFSETGVYFEEGQKFGYPHVWGQKGPWKNYVKLVFTDKSLCDFDSEEKPCKEVKFVNEMIVKVSGQKVGEEVKVFKVEPSGD